MTKPLFTQLQYDQAAPFSSFLPGIAGLYGKPLWCYYVNRGQGVACFDNRPFRMEQDELVCEFSPVLPSWAFSERDEDRVIVRADGSELRHRFVAGDYGALLLGKTLVVYHNPERVPTYGANGAHIRSISLHEGQEKVTKVEGSRIIGILARKIRDGAVTKIDIELAQQNEVQMST